MHPPVEGALLRYGMSRTVWRGGLLFGGGSSAVVLALLLWRLPPTTWDVPTGLGALLAAATCGIAMLTLWRQPEPPDLLRASSRGLELRASSGGQPWDRYVAVAWPQVDGIRVEKRLHCLCLVIEIALDETQRAQLANRGINRITGREEVLIARQGLSDLAPVAAALLRLREAARNGADS